MSAIGLGLDLVEIDRIASMLERYGERVLDRVLTRVESDYCKSKVAPARHVAARIAAKEAAFKALGTLGNDAYVGWHDIEVTHGPTGGPELGFVGRGSKVAEDLGVRSTVLSLTHTNRDAAAAVVLIG